MMLSLFHLFLESAYLRHRLTKGRRQIFKRRATLRLLHKQVAMFLRYGLSFVIMLHSDDDFSLSVFFFKISEGFSSFT